MRKLLALLVCGLLVLTGCGGPAGQKEQVGGWQLTVPAGWKEASPSSNTWTKAWEGDGMRLEVSGDRDGAPGADGLVQQLSFQGQLSLSDFNASKTQKVSVDGAKDAARVDFTFSDGANQRSGMWLGATAYPAAKGGLIAISSKQGDLDQQKVDQIVKSLSWHR